MNYLSFILAYEQKNVIIIVSGSCMMMRIVKSGGFGRVTMTGTGNPAILIKNWIEIYC